MLTKIGADHNLIFCLFSSDNISKAFEHLRLSAIQFCYKCNASQTLTLVSHHRVIFANYIFLLNLKLKYKRKIVAKIFAGLHVAEFLALDGGSSSASSESGMG